MKFPGWIWIALLGALTFVAPLRAETVLSVATAPGAEVAIKLTLPAAQAPRFGFAAVRVTIENTAPQDRTWQVQFQAGVRGQFPGVAALDRSFTVPAGRTTDAWVYVPVAEPGMPGTAPAFGPASMSASPAPVSTSPRVTIAATPVGTKVTRIIGISGGPRNRTLTEEREIDAQTGVITTTNVGANGLPSGPARTTPPLNPGTETTFRINPNTGAISTSTRIGANASTPPKVSIITTPATGSPTASRAMPVRPGGPGFSGPPMLLTAEFTGPGLVGGGRVTFPSLPASANMRPLAATPAIERWLREALSYEGIRTPNLAAIEPAQLPADWRVWSGFGTLLLTADEFAGLDAARRAALRGWIVLGGQLVLVPGAATVGNTLERLGAGAITTLFSPLSAAPAVGDVHRLGVLPDRTLAQPDVETLMVRGASALGEAVAEKETDSTWLTVFLVVFASVVGPINLFVFAPATKRHRLFITTPLISLAAALLLGATILVQDGVGGDGLRRSLVVLVPGDHQAAVFQEQVARTGFLTGRAFALADDTQLTVLPLEEVSLGRIGNFSSTPPLRRDEARASGDWFRSRGRQAHLLQRLVPTRGRVERVGTGFAGAPIVQSSLAGPLRDFVCEDEKGELWSARELAPGQRVTLESGGRMISATSLGGTRRLGELLAASAPRFGSRWSAKGGAGDLAPLATLGAVRWAKDEVVYTGVLEGVAVEKTEAKR